MRSPGDHGYAMAALLVGLSVMSIVLSMALPVWRTAAQRERETELIFRGEQYARAVELFQRKYAGAFPPDLDILLKERFLRQRYTDPITDGDFQLLYVGQALMPPGQQPGQPQPEQQAQSQPQRGQQAPAPAAGGLGARGRAGGPGGQAGIMGVASTSTGASLRLYNGRGRYNEWTFVAVQASTQGGSGAQAQGARGRGGRGDAAAGGRGDGLGRGLPPGRRGSPFPQGMSPAPPGPGPSQRGGRGL